MATSSQDSAISITIHRGASQVGGCATEIATGRTRILIDFGSTLVGSASEITDEDIKGVFEARHFDAVLFTHYHADHTGLMKHIPDDVPIYMGRFCRDVMRIMADAMQDDAASAILNDDNRTHAMEYFPHHYKIGDFQVTPFFVDHSAFLSYAYLIEAAGKRIFYSGDVRQHGYLGKGLLPTLRKLVRQVDVLILEGTNLGRQASSTLSEHEMRTSAEKILRRHDANFLICSSTNFDSLASFHQAAKNVGIPVYVLSETGKRLCELFTDEASPYSPMFNLKDIRSYKDFKDEKPHRFLLIYSTLLNKRDLSRYHAQVGHYKGAALIYSLWDGYVNPTSSAFDPVLAHFVDSFGDNAYHLHTTGHADSDTLAEIIMALRPREAIIPIHTEHGEMYRDLPIGEYRQKVRQLADGESFSLRMN